MRLFESYRTWYFMCNLLLPRNWSAMPQPVLTVWAAPSTDRAAIRAWTGATAMASMRTWLQAAETAPQTWRDTEHNAAWNWPAGGGRTAVQP